jgi:hypothetical protein
MGNRRQSRQTLQYASKFGGNLTVLAPAKRMEQNHYGRKPSQLKYFGGVAEWLNAPVLKTGRGLRLS